MDITTLISTHKKLLLVGFLVLILIFLVTFPLYGSVYYTRLLIVILMYVTLSVSWAMFSGSTGYMSLAPAAFFGVGMYTMALLQYKLPFPVIIVVGGLLGFILALLIGMVTLRLKGMYFAIFTFGLVVFMARVVAYAESQITGQRGQHIIPLDDTTIFYAMLGLTIVTLLAIYFIRRSRVGLAMQSIGGNEDAAEHMGINTTMVKVLTFAISSIFMGAAGVITAPRLIYINADIAFSPTFSFMPILMSIFGGMGHFYGPVVGAAVFGYLEKTLRAQFSTYFMLGFGIIMVAVILFLPNGIAGLVPMLRDKLGGVISKWRKGGQAEQHANT
ncbi:MAG TPA: branched-chain amino acid ABC transporter permease [Dehalococcoidia bacterium]|jgi:branched-chain amino acid transport system permease protein